MGIILIALLTILIMGGCSTTGDYAITGIGSVDGDAAITVGKVVSDTAEVGVTGVFYAIEDEHYTPAVGVYAAYLVPLPDEIQEDWQPFAGGALAMETEDFGLIPKMFAGLIYKPTDVVSPLYMVERAWPSDDISTPDIASRGNDIYHWFGLRYRF